MAPVATEPHALRVEGVVRRFGALVAVGGVDLHVPPGERRAVLGANGAGKTTLFNMIAGDLPLSEGRIVVFGEDMTRMPAEKRVLRGVRRTYQKSLVFGGLTVRENLFVAIRGAAGRRYAIRRKAQHEPEFDATTALAERVSLADRLDHPASDLSHGEQRQLELGMALAGEPRLLLLDEPAAGLSMRERGSLLSMLRGLPRDVTLVIIEHDLDIALAVADRVTVMHNGIVLAEGTPAEISANQQIHDIYMGKHV